jgi:hypothetical protein
MPTGSSEGDCATAEGRVRRESALLGSPRSPYRTRRGDRALTVLAIRRSTAKRARDARRRAREDRYMALQAEVYEASEAGWRPDVSRVAVYEQTRTSLRSAAGLPIDDG